MNNRKSTAVEYFQQWLADPLVLDQRSVSSSLETLNQHPMATDSDAFYQFMPMQYARSEPGKFAVMAESQELFLCYVKEEQAQLPDPPVYLETDLDLIGDFDLPEERLIDDNTVEVTDHFSRFLWHMLGWYVCVRVAPGTCLAPQVTGLRFEKELELTDEFLNPLGKPFPSGNTCYFSEDTIYVADWGAAFLNEAARESFRKRFAIVPDAVWSVPKAAERVSTGKDGLRFDGVYSRFDGAMHRHLRFFEDGKVNFILIDKGPGVMSKGFGKAFHQKHGGGTFRLDGENVAFTITQFDVVVDYSGKIRTDDLRLNIFSHKTQHRSRETFTFRPVEFVD